VQRCASENVDVGIRVGKRKWSAGRPRREA